MVNKVLRFTYSSLSVKGASCHDCELYGSCGRVKRGRNAGMLCDLLIIKKIHNPVVVEAEWDLSQLLHQISVSMMGANLLKNEYMREWTIPDSLKGILNEKPPFKECCIYIDVMRVFYKYLKENEEMLKRNNRMDAMIKTVIAVQDNKVISSSSDSKLNKEIEEIVKGSEYRFTTGEPVFGAEENNIGGKKK